MSRRNSPRDPRLHLADPARPLLSLCGLALSNCLQGTDTLAILVEPSLIRLEIALGHWLGPGCTGCAQDAIKRALGERSVGRPIPAVRLLTGSASPVTAETLRDLRRRARLTRAALAAMAGVAETTIRNLETKRHRATEKVLAKLRAVPALWIILNPEENDL